MKRFFCITAVILVLLSCSVTAFAADFDSELCGTWVIPLEAYDSSYPSATLVVYGSISSGSYSMELNSDVLLYLHSGGISVNSCSEPLTMLDNSFQFYMSQYRWHKYYSIGVGSVGSVLTEPLTLVIDSVGDGDRDTLFMWLSSNATFVPPPSIFDTIGISNVMNAMTSQISVENVVAVLAVIAGAGVGFAFMWWGVRKAVSALMAAFKKGKIKL